MKSASAAAESLVADQSNWPEPKMTRTICARRTIMRESAGIDQKNICRSASSIWRTNSARLHAAWKRASVGIAATEYETPLIASGTDCKFHANMKMAKDPTAKRE